jgi:putative ABC transport system substrate-binding protein
MDAQIAALRERANVREPIRSRHGGNDEAARVYRAFGRECHMAFTAMAQEPGRIYRLGLLTSYPPYDPAQADTVVALLGALRQRGFIEGKNLTLVVRAFGLHRELMSEYAAELVKAQVDVIYTGGPSGIRAVQQATQTIPILAITDDMLGSGLVKSMSRPDGNTTGVSILATELDGKRQEILIEAVPGIRRIAALADVYTTANDQALVEAARARNVELSIYRIKRAEEIAAAINEAHASGAAALNVLGSPILDLNRQIIMGSVAALRLPAIYQWPERAEEGGFAAYGPRLLQLYREVLARQLVQLFQGVKPADIPVEQPTKFVLVVNLKTAKALGLTIPETFLTRADEVIE